MTICVVCDYDRFSLMTWIWFLQSVARNLCNYLYIYINSFFHLFSINTGPLLCAPGTFFLFGFPPHQRLTRAGPSESIEVHYQTPSVREPCGKSPPRTPSEGNGSVLDGVLTTKFHENLGHVKIAAKKTQEGYKFIVISSWLKKWVPCTWLWRNLDINPLDIIQFIWAWSNLEQSIMTLWH